MAAQVPGDAPPGKKKVFPFFELPREMRDIVYAASFRQQTSIKTKYFHQDVSFHPHFHHFELDHSLDPKLLLVSKQMKLEYEEAGERIAQSQKLTVRLNIDLISMYPSFTTREPSPDNDHARSHLAETLSTIPTLEVVLRSLRSDRLRMDDGQFPLDCLEAAEQVPLIMDFWIRDVPSLQTATLTHSGKARSAAMALHLLLTKDCATDKFLYVDKKTNQAIHFKHNVLITTPLYETLELAPSWIESDHARADYGPISTLLFEHPGSSITYRGHPSSGPYAYRGFDLEQVSPHQTVDFTAVRREASDSLDAIVRAQTFEEGEQVLRDVSKKFYWTKHVEHSFEDSFEDFFRE